MGALIGRVGALACTILAGMMSACTMGTISGGLDDTAGGPAKAPSSQNPFGNDALVAAAPETRVVRLSQAQYANTVRDLLGISESSDVVFAPDSLNGFKFDTSDDLRVDARLGPSFRASAEDLAQRAVADGAVFGRLVPCQSTDAGCAEQFVRAFGARAFRRPLSDGEVARFKTLFDAGNAVGETGDAFRDGVQIVVEAMLQSPQFLYRTEVSQGTVTDGRAALSDWEIASRLSYFLYDSMPDDTLFEQARQGALHTEDQIAAQVTRMIEDPRATQKFVSFHEQLWQFGRYAKIAPDPETYRNVPQDFVERLLASSDKFLQEVIAEGGGLEQFLNAPYAFADAKLAPYYGVSGAGAASSADELLRVDFTHGERKGFLMQLGFLASNSYSIKTDPIHRGLFILRDLLCRAIPDPPPGAAQTPLPEAKEPIKTTRQEVTLLTGQLYCPTCHAQINEPGFSFEEFDALGQSRTQENGVNVDTTGSITLDGQTVSFQSASQLVDALTQSDEARDCYASRWLEFASGRSLSTLDQPLRDHLAAQPLSLKDLVMALATSPEFRSRVDSVDPGTVQP
jgi:hypothetical protein